MEILKYSMLYLRKHAAEIKSFFYQTPTHCTHTYPDIFVMFLNITQILTFHTFYYVIVLHLFEFYSPLLCNSLSLW